MTIEIMKMSPKAEEVAKTKATNLQTIYPFDLLEVGQCFTVPAADAKLNSLQAIASQKGKKQNKKFIVIKHENPAVIEVARIA